MARKTASELLDRRISGVLAKPRSLFSNVEMEAGAGTLHGRGARVSVLSDLLNLDSVLRDLPHPDFKARLKTDLERRASMASAPEPQVNYIRQGFHTVTPYLIISNAAQWVEFAKQAFGAEEKFRAQRPGTDAIMHAEVQIGDSMIELADANPQYPAMPSTLLLRVRDPDSVYDRAVAAGATPFQPMKEQEYGVRGGSLRDSSGNNWFVFTPLPGDTTFTPFRSITPHLHPEKSGLLIEFIQKAFAGEEVYRAQSPDGIVHHAQVRIGDSLVGMGDAHGEFPAAPCTLHLYVADTDALYERAMRAGAESIQPPADQPYGDRSAGIRDPFGNRWFIATHVRDVAP